MEPVLTNFKSDLRMTGLVCSNITLERDPDHPVVEDFKLQFNKRLSFTEDYQKAKVVLGVTAYTPDSLFKASVTMVGHFEFAEAASSDFAEEIISKNAVSIIFPYLRSQLSLATTQPNMSPVIIPPINIHALFKNDDATKAGPTE